MVLRCKHTGEVLDESSWPDWARRRGTLVSRRYDRQRRLLADRARQRVGGRLVRPSDVHHPLHQLYKDYGYPAVYAALGKPMPSDEFVQRLDEVRSKHQKEIADAEDYHTGVKEGFVYVISNPSWPNLVKIGSAVDPESRLATFQTSDPYRNFRLRGAFYCKDRKSVETKLHAALAEVRLTGSEWFKLDPRVACYTISSFVRCFTQND